MGDQKVYRAIGLMSGTVLDGEIDVALLETDGQGYVDVKEFYAHPYDKSVREKVRACFGKYERDALVDEADALVTDIHIDAVKASGFEADVIGFHGQTITHAPDEAFTWQIGDGARLAKSCSMAVVSDMRQADIKAGGQGAPLLPLYHAARLSMHKEPIAVLNLGGVSNITYIDNPVQEIIAFDCGPGNALMDDYMRVNLGKDYDEGGAYAASGTVSEALVERYLEDEYFALMPPKSLDRNHWDLSLVAGLPEADAMATLLKMSVLAIKQGVKMLPRPVHTVYVCGGGRKNAALMMRLSKWLGEVRAVEDIGWNGDATEAEGFAYLAVRSLLGLPLTLPSTTGVAKLLTGGVLHKP